MQEVRLSLQNVAISISTLLVTIVTTFGTFIVILWIASERFYVFRHPDISLNQRPWTGGVLSDHQATLSYYQATRSDDSSGSFNSDDESSTRIGIRSHSRSMSPSALVREYPVTEDDSRTTAVTEDTDTFAIVPAAAPTPKQEDQAPHAENPSISLVVQDLEGQTGLSSATGLWKRALTAVTKLPGQIMAPDLTNGQHVEDPAPTISIIKLEEDWEIVPTTPDLNNKHRKVPILLATINTSQFGTIQHFAFSPDAKYFAVAWCAVLVEET